MIYLHRQFAQSEIHPSTLALPSLGTYLVALLGPSHRVVPSRLLAPAVLEDQLVQPGLEDQPVLAALKTFREEISWTLKVFSNLETRGEGLTDARGRNAAWCR